MFSGNYSMWSDTTPYFIWTASWSAILIKKEEFAHNIERLLAAPMTNARWLQNIKKVCPEFEQDIIHLPEHATIAEFWCGKAVTIQDLLCLDPNFKITWIDCIPLKEHTWFTFTCGDLDSQLVWESIPDGSLDYGYSFFTSMYLKNPILFLQKIQKKLKDTWTALVHLWYNEQYIWWYLSLLSTVLGNLPANNLWIWEAGWSEMFPLFILNWIDNIYKNNLSIELEPIYVKIDAHTNLNTSYNLLSKLWFYIQQWWRTYKTRHSEKWYTYDIQDKTKK